jgi:stromal membrane-associated protein
MNRQKALMKKYLSRPENRYCADCKRPSPTWASLNLGVFVCIKCSGCHREIGVHITKIKSVELDLWPSKALTDFAKINNEIANAYWEYDLKNYDFQRIRDNEIRLIEFIRDKYEFRRWAKPRVPDPMSLVLQGRDLVKEFMNNGEAVKIYEKNEDPELEKRSQHFGRQKNEKKGKSFGIVDKVDKVESNHLDNNTNINNINQINNNNINNNSSNMNNKKPEKGFGFIKRKQNKNDNNDSIKNIENNSNANTSNNIDLLGFGNEQNDNTINNLNQTNSNSDNNFPLDIFSIGINQSNNSDININDNINNNINKNINDNINNNISNNINSSPNSININQNNTFSINSQQKLDNSANNNKQKSGFSFIKKKNINQNNQSNNNIYNNNITPPSQSSNNANDINDIFSPNPIKNIIVNNKEKNENNNLNMNQNNSINNTSNNNILNIFENDQLVDLFNIETPTSDAVLNLSKNLLNVYSEKEEDKNINNANTIPNNNINSSSSNYNVLNMNYLNININNYYPNTQQNKNKLDMMNSNYGINPMMGYNYQPQPNYNNFGFWYGYGINNNIGGQYMGMNMNKGPINPGFNYQPEFYKKEKEIEKDEPKPILLNTDSFELNLKKNKEKDDPFKNLVHFK